MTQLPIITILRTEADYEAALAEFETYFNNEPADGSPEADRFELLGLVIAHFEKEHAEPAQPRHPVDVDALLRLTEALPMQDEGAGAFVRRMRDEDRY